MASFPSFASTRSIPAPAATANPGLFAEMLRLWLEHHRRLAQVGIVPL